MPFIDYHCARCGAPSGDFSLMADPCKHCGCPDKRSGHSFGFKMPTESPARYDAWFKSESTQQKLKTGEYEILSKSADANHL